MESRNEYSSNVVRVLHPTNNSWEDKQHYESKTSRSNMLDSSNQQLSSTNFIREAQTNYSTRSNYSTKSNREYIDDGLLQTPQHKITTTTTTTKNYGTQKNAGGGGGNVDYLDELLDDLKHERTHTQQNTDLNDYNTTTTSYKYNSSSNIPETTNLNKRSEYYDSKMHRTNTNNAVHHQDIYNTSKSISSNNLIEHNPHTGHTIKRTEHVEILPQSGGSSVQRSKHVEIMNSKSQETVPLLPPHTNSSSSETTVKRDVVVKNVGHPSSIATDLNEIPLDPSLSENLLPLPGTKVTTTVRTYTYEVPSVVTRTNVLYHDDIREDITSPINTSTINKNYSEKITNINDNYSTTTTKKDTRLVNGNLPSPNDNTPHHNYPLVQEPDDVGPGPKRTYYYKHEVHNTKNTVNQPPPPGFVNEYHLTKNTNTTTTNRYPPVNDAPTVLHPLRPISPESISPAPPPSVTHHTYVTKTTTTNDYTDGPRPRNLSPHDGPSRPPYDVSMRPHSPGPVTSTYIRSHEKTTSSTMPFPVDSSYPVDGSVQPPKKVDELMASFDRNGDDVDSEALRRKHEIDTSIANTDNKVRVPSRNQAGPPVFYPPNSELTLRQKEEGGAWRAQGGYAAGASGYEYHAESSSKSKSKSGAAVVPVCLPLCCAMPCVLM